MGRHDHPDSAWTRRHIGYQCEGCKGFWAALQLDEGVLPGLVICLATEHCRGPVVVLMPTSKPAPDWVPILAEWIRPDEGTHFRNEPYLNDHLDRGGLLVRPTIDAPNWVKRRLGYFGGLRPI